MTNDKKFHWFPFYYQAWMTDMNVQMLSHAEKGLYIDMLCSCFNEDGLPADHKLLKRLFKCCDDDLKMVVTLFHERDGKLHNKKLDEIKADQAEVSQKKSLAGKASAQARKAKALTEVTGVEQVLNPVATEPQQNPTSRVEDSRVEDSRVEDSKNNTTASDDAERVYQAYPRKKCKQPALKAITKALKTTSADQLVEHLNLYSESVKGKDKQFLPHPATYFNEGRHLEPVEIITKAEPNWKLVP